MGKKLTIEYNYDIGQKVWKNEHTFLGDRGFEWLTVCYIVEAMKYYQGSTYPEGVYYDLTGNGCTQKEIMENELYESEEDAIIALREMETNG